MAMRRAGLFSAMTSARTASPVSGTKKMPWAASFWSNLRRLPVSCTMPPSCANLWATTALLHKKQSSTYKKYACGCFLFAPCIYLIDLHRALPLFENRRGKYKEVSKNKAQAYQIYVEHLFLRNDAVITRIFSKIERTSVTCAI